MRSSLARHMADDPADDGELRRLAAAAWHRRGVVVLWPRDIRDPWHREVVRQVAERIYGQRKEGQ